MFFRFEYIGDENLISIPDSITWRLVQKFFDEQGSQLLEL